MQIRLTYRKENGKYYSEGTLELPEGTSFEDTLKEVSKLMDMRNCPGLRIGHSPFVVTIRHPERYATLYPADYIPADEVE